MSQLKPIVDLLLTETSSAYIPEGFLSDTLFPLITSKNSTGKLGKYGMDYLRIENSLKGGRGSYRRIEPITRNTSGFTIEGHGLEDIVTKEDYANVELPFKAEEDSVLGVSTTLWVEKESIVATALGSTSVMTQNTTLAGTAQFSDYNNSDPLSKFLAARKAIRSGCGTPPNVAIMDWDVINVLRFHPQMLDALGFKWATPGGLSPDQLAVALGVDKLLIAKASYNTAKEGQTDALGPIWGKHIIFAVLPDKAVPYQTSLGYMVRYEGDTPRKVYKQPNFNPPGSTLVLVEDNYDSLISNTGAGYLIANAIA